MKFYLQIEEYSIAKLTDDSDAYGPIEIPSDKKDWIEKTMDDFHKVQDYLDTFYIKLEKD